ncbi:hypothetical protein SGLAD_v1c03630 [Spiroplasma gladiatoris]|uniref:Uncharacterized protein n=1 Tax=Spiroplasma gladiatoris TaxID=2143 RepID=A0A4P7AHA7_9MOLU|nr:hypothetical protein [Spiroplasma gladiatoris]QBQ07562.1 hypothetical protein SGLAD_v1c03630 [Spiroplasma gladiatoris]
MYISIDYNEKGNLEIEEKAIEKMIEFHVISNTKGITDVKASFSLHHENTLFILIKLFVKNKEELEINEKELTSKIEKSIQKTFLYKPKNVAFAYIKK